MEYTTQNLSKEVATNTNKDTIATNAAISLENNSKKDDNALTKLLIKKLGTNNIDKLKEIKKICDLNNISVNQILLGDYYLTTIDNMPTILTKYTTYAKELYKEIGEYSTKFECLTVENELAIKCIITTNNGISHEGIAFMSTLKNRKNLESLQRQAFKNCLRFNFAKIMSFYDEDDKKIIESVEKEKSPLLSALEQSIGGNK